MKSGSETFTKKCTFLILIINENPLTSAAHVSGFRGSGLHRGVYCVTSAVGRRTSIHSVPGGVRLTLVRADGIWNEERGLHTQWSVSKLFIFLQNVSRGLSQ